MKIARPSLCVLIVLSATIAIAQGPASTPQKQPTASSAVNELPEAKILNGLYSGTWVTTNRKLDGTMKCELKDLENDRWQGRFWGVWQGVAFDYTVQFETQKVDRAEKYEPAQKGEKAQTDAAPRSAPIQVSGKAMIDGAHYDWKGTLSREEFDIQFTGSRYNGYCELARVKEKQPQLRKLAENQTQRK